MIGKALTMRHLYKSANAVLGKYVRKKRPFLTFYIYYITNFGFFQILERLKFEREIIMGPAD